MFECSVAKIYDSETNPGGREKNPTKQISLNNEHALLKAIQKSVTDKKNPGALLINKAKLSIHLGKRNHVS